MKDFVQSLELYHFHLVMMLHRIFQQPSQPYRLSHNRYYCQMYLKYFRSNAMDPAGFLKLTSKIIEEVEKPICD